jgi:hypothetical protein
MDFFLFGSLVCRQRVATLKLVKALNQWTTFCRAERAVRLAASPRKAHPITVIVWEKQASVSTILYLESEALQVCTVHCVIDIILIRAQGAD